MLKVKIFESYNCGHMITMYAIIAR
ncbi:hypothetical protein MTR67_000950 [Solanum verrucosum]|uniref:Uncharacterized protein n=1 Tax=Solanum verrucosum TaxID=315347 RepID=A0AAF0PPI4_SOLVR|nr:hypothetical protein MTR67_000950 [Solanum verrucosum]